MQTFRLPTSKIYKGIYNNIYKDIYKGIYKNEVQCKLWSLEC